MAENILPGAVVPSLPSEEAIQWGASVKGPDILALANAITHLVAARGRRWYRRTFTPHVDTTLVSVSSIDDGQETHTISLIPSPHCNRYHVRVVYQGDPGGKLAGGEFIRATLMTRIDGTGTDLDEVEWNAAEGTLPLKQEGVEAVNTALLALQFALLEVQTAYLSRPGAGSGVSRPLEIGTGTPDPDFTIKVISSQYVRVLAIDVWEAFEEVIEQ